MITRDPNLEQAEEYLRRRALEAIEEDPDPPTIFPTPFRPLRMVTPGFRCSLKWGTPPTLVIS